MRLSDISRASGGRWVVLAVDWRWRRPLSWAGWLILVVLASKIVSALTQLGLAPSHPLYHH